MELKNEIFNSKEYTLVDEYEKSIGRIYHFVGDEDNIFCIKKDSKYEIITDFKIIDEIMEECSLKPQEIYFAGILLISLINGIENKKKLQEEEKNKIIEEQIDILQTIVNKKELNERLKNVRIYTTTSINGGIGGFFHPASNSIFFYEKDINSCEDNSRRTRLHETIHAIMGEKAFFISYSNKSGLNEGGTENIVEKKMGSKTSSYAGNCDIQYNVSSKAKYKHQIGLIRQMEFAIGKDLDESILKGNLDFFKDFSKKYGKDLFRFINHRANRLLHSEKINDLEGYIKETSDTILERIFNKDFENIKSIQEIEEYFTKLREFETIRPRIKNDNRFKEFYDEKIEEAKDIINSIYNNEELTDRIVKKIQYKEQELYPLELEEQRKRRYQNYIIKNMVKSAENSDNKDIDTEDFKFMTAYEKDKEYLILMKNGKVIAINYGKFGERTYIEYSPKMFEYFKQEDKIIVEGENTYFIDDEGNKVLIEGNSLIQDESIVKNQNELKTKVNEKINKNKEEQEIRVSKQKEKLKRNASKYTISDLKKMVIVLKKSLNNEKQIEQDINENML